MLYLYWVGNSSQKTINVTISKNYILTIQKLR